MIVRLPSGICKTLRILATVPILLISPILGSETLLLICETTPINLSPLLAALINLTDLFLVAVIGITTPGNSTVFFKGRIDSDFGNFSLFIASSSSDVIRGMSSDSSLIIFPESLFKSNKFSISRTD